MSFELFDDQSEFQELFFDINLCCSFLKVSLSRSQMLFYDGSLYGPELGATSGYDRYETCSSSFLVSFGVSAI